MTSVELILRDRTPQPSVVQFYKDANGIPTAYHTPYSAEAIPALLRFITGKASKDDNRFEIDTGKLEFWKPTGLDKEVVVDNIRMAMAMEAIANDLIQGNIPEDEWPPHEFFQCIYGYLLETRCRLDQERLKDAARRWDIVDIVKDVHTLAKKHGFNPKHPLVREMTLTDGDLQLPKPDLIVPEQVYAPLTYWHYKKLHGKLPDDMSGRVPSYVQP